MVPQARGAARGPSRGRKTHTAGQRGWGPVLWRSRPGSPCHPPGRPTPAPALGTPGVRDLAIPGSVRLDVAWALRRAGLGAGGRGCAAEVGGCSLGPGMTRLCTPQSLNPFPTGPLVSAPQKAHSAGPPTGHLLSCSWGGGGPEAEQTFTGLSPWAGQSPRGPHLTAGSLALGCPTWSPSPVGRVKGPATDSVGPAVPGARLVPSLFCKVFLFFYFYFLL